MGRTVPTFNLSLDREMASWGAYRRALRKEDQESFDRLFALAKQHMAEAAAAARPIPFDALVMSVLLELQKRVERLEGEVATLRGEAIKGGQEGAGGAPPPGEADPDLFGGSLG
jgi:hypothetical protein